AGQAVAERHRPGRRQAVLPVRAGVHLRAQPGRRRGPGPAGLRRRKAEMTPDEIVAELRDGMTFGIGGWGSRRKPMALIRAILRSPLKDLTIVSYAGTDVGLLVASAHRLPFLPIRAGLGSGVLEVNPELRTVRSPYPDGEELVAMPALRLD